VRDEKGKSKGFGFLEFADEDGMKKAIEQRELPIKDKVCLI